MASSIRSLIWLTFAAAGTACISHATTDTSTVLANPAEPTQTVATTPSTAAVCGTICDALIEDYGVPTSLKSACVFECASGFANVPQACYELVACVADKSLCSGGDISVPCEAKAGDCFAQWSLANGSCRGCWEPSRTVHGTQIVTYTTDPTPRPEDFSALTIGALLPRRGGDPYLFPGTGNADGTYVIPNVPGCGVWIQVGTTYTWSGNADVDTSYTFPGRRNAQIAGPNTTFDFQLNNLVAWNQNDWVELFMPNLASYTSSETIIEPENGMTIADGATSYLWSVPANNAALPDAAQHDDITVTDAPTQTLANGTIVRTIARAATLSGFTAKDGVSNPATVTLTDLANKGRTAHVDFRRSTFFQAFADLHPATQIGAPDAAYVSYGVVDIVTQPGKALVGVNADLLVAEKNDGTEDIPPFDLPFGTPYPADWGIEIVGAVGGYVALKDRNGHPFYAFERIVSGGSFDTWGSKPLVMTLGPPRHFTINGQTAYAQQQGGTLTPTLAWDPPAVGTPVLYRLIVHKMTTGASEGGPRSVVATVVIPTLPGASEPALRSITLPPGILERGTDYYFRLFAESSLDAIDNSANVASSEYMP